LYEVQDGGLWAAAASSELISIGVVCYAYFFMVGHPVTMAAQEMNSEYDTIPVAGGDSYRGNPSDGTGKQHLGCIRCYALNNA
jgi:hypothetical protein